MSQAEALRALKELLDAKITDRFAVGTVIRWVANERYTYAVIKTGAGWWPTSRPGNPFVPGGRPIEFEDLVEILSRSEVSQVAIATTWATLDGVPITEPFDAGDEVAERPLAKVNHRLKRDVDNEVYPEYGDEVYDYPGMGGESI